MNILDKIVAFKRVEVKARKNTSPVTELEKSPYFTKRMASFYDALDISEPSIIGEFKRKSPSKGLINIHSDPDDVARGYEDAGIAAMSVLTDTEFFGGVNQDLQKVAGFAKIPLLRKDFIIDEYQVIESKSIGASAILLIASILSREEIKFFSGLAFDIGLDVLYEIHEARDLDKVSDRIKIIGVNNRDLNTFDINFENSMKLLSYLPSGCIKVAESGFKTFRNVNLLYSSGYNSFLIGENFMKSDNPGRSAKVFMNDLYKSRNETQN
jgi:indole-3-glycerol phosphate synthase